MNRGQSARRAVWVAGIALAALVVSSPAGGVASGALAPPAAGSAVGPPAGRVPAAGTRAQDDATLRRWAAATWQSFVAMTDQRSGLPADALAADGTRSVQTSTTNIGAYMWSAVVARRLGIISSSTLVRRLSRTLGTLEHMERHQPSGQFYNWYNHRSGKKLTTWPPTGEPLTPILSSVDNGWLATGLRIVSGDVPRLASRAGALYHSMDFGFYYRPDVNRILFNYAPDTGDAPCCYDTVVSESRIASYIGIANGQIPQREYFGAFRAFPATCTYSFQERLPVGPTHQYFGERVFDGAYRYAGHRITPGWGGSAFEDLMPALFVPEERWAPGSWRLNHPETVRAQIHHGLVDAGYGYWGFSPSNTPEGGYSVYGVDAVGSNPEGYPSDEGGTFVDHGFPARPGCDARPAQADPPPSAYSGGVVTPHAAFLSLRYGRTAAMRDLRRLAADFPIMTRWGFRDSVNVDTGTVSDSYLSLDQGIIMAAIGNALAEDLLRRAFDGPDFQRRVRPVMGVERFNDSPLRCTIRGTKGPDVLNGTPGRDVICAGAGDDVIRSGGGSDVVYSGGGNDLVRTGGGEDVVYGGGGNDIAFGGTGRDVLVGDDGDDQLTDRQGPGLLEGSTGVDVCQGRGARDCEAG